jgi:hypothetical protein
MIAAGSPFVVSHLICTPRGVWRLAGRCPACYEWTELFIPGGLMHDRIDWTALRLLTTCCGLELPVLVDTDNLAVDHRTGANSSAGTLVREKKTGAA